MTRFYVSLVDLAHRRARLVVALFLIVTAALLYYTVTHLGIDTNTDKMLDQKLPFLQHEHEFERAFPQFDDVMVIVVEASDTPQAQAAGDAMAARLRSRPDLYATVYQPGRGDVFEKNGLLYLSEDELWKLNDRLAEAGPWLGRLSVDPSQVGLFSVFNDAVTHATLTPVQEQALGKVMDRITAVATPGSTQRLNWTEVMLGDSAKLGPQGKDFVLIQARLDAADTLGSTQRALDAMRAFVDEYHHDPAHAGIRMRITGSPAMDAEELDTVSQGAELSTSLSFVLVWLVLIVALRALKPAVAILLTLFCGLSWTAAFATFAIGSLNLISVSFAVLFIGLGVDFGIQFAMRYREELDRGSATREALRHAAGGVGGALALAALAAAACFFAFVPTSYRGLAELGKISGAGMFIALFANLTLLPALLTVLPIQPSKPETAFGRMLQSWGSARGSRHRLVFAAAVLVGLASAALLPFARFDPNPLNMKDPSTEAVATFFDLLNDPDTTPYTLDILTPSLDAAKSLATELEKLPTVDKAVTLASYVPSDQDSKLSILSDIGLILGPAFQNPGAGTQHTDEERAASIRSLSEALKQAKGSDAFRAQTTRLSEALDRVLAALGSQPDTLSDLEGRLLNDLPQQLTHLRKLLTATPFGLSDLPQDLRERYVSADGHARVEVFPKENLKDNAAMRRFVNTVEATGAHISGTPSALIGGGDAVVEACLQASIIAVVAIIILLMVALRSLLDTVLVLAPLALAALLTVATTVLLGLSFDLANLIALPLLVGIGVAFGIYLVHRWRSESDLKDAMNSSTPRAIFFSAMTTMVSFGTLAISPHRGMSHMGELLTIALSFALLCTLLILPALLSLTKRKK